MKRRVERFPVSDGRNAMHQWPRLAGFTRTLLRFVIIWLGRYTPWIGLKNGMYRAIGMRIGKDAAIGLMVMPDIFFPEKIEIGDNTIIGYNTTILCHEFLVEEYRIGTVKIGSRVMIGANCTILPGVEIGDGAVVSAHSLVNRDVPAGAVVGGVPARIIRRKTEREETELGVGLSGNGGSNTDAADER